MMTDLKSSLEISKLEKYYELCYPQHTQSEARGGDMFVIPVPFSKYHNEMLVRCKELLEYRDGYTSIHPRFNKLITALRTAIADEWNLDKKATSHDDLLDAFRMSLQYWVSE
jgi:hypothetical protein